MVLDNLLDNAIKFSSNVPKPKIEFGTTMFEDKKAYFVKDNGVGFDMDYANKLFAPLSNYIWMAFSRVQVLDWP